jgi:hypothetical protein
LAAVAGFQRASWSAMNASIVLAPRLLQLDASGSEELSGQPECVEVRLDGAAGLVLGSEVQLEGANQVSYAGVGHDRTVP